MSTTIKIRENKDDSDWILVTNVVGIQCSWEVNRAGMFSCQVPRSEFRKVLTAATYVGSMLAYEHAQAGTWAGKITSFGVRDGMVEIGAQSLHILARKRLGKWTGTMKKPAGLVLGDVIDSSNETVDNLFKIKWVQDAKEKDPGYIEGSTSPNLKIPPTAGIDLYDELIPMITDDMGYEWKIDESRYITYKQRIGTDKSKTVTLTEGVHIVSASWTDDLADVTNILRGFYLAKG